MTLKEKRNNLLYTSALIPHGNNKLLDYTDENGVSFRYAQVNTRPITDCPFRSAGCEKVCYATKGNHCFPSVKESRERAYKETRREDYTEAMVYTVRTEKESKRFRDSVMLIRLHESGDFYSMQYLRKNLHIWEQFKPEDGVQFKFYTKSFPFFLMLSPEEKKALNALLDNGVVVMNLSLDDTTDKKQVISYLQMMAEFPKANTYYATEDVDSVHHDHVCDCANCAKCGICNKATGETTVVKIHSASNADMEEYRKNIK